MTHDLDLLRRFGFAAAQQATVSLRVIDKDRVTPSNLHDSDFTLIVNGTKRVGHLHAPNAKTIVVAPMVLLVFPPNQPVVHWIAVRQATQYFSQQPTELLSWKVGIFDSNGKLTPFTDGRSQLIEYLNVVGHTREPIQYYTSNWLTNAENAIGIMQDYEGPKVILAMNPLAESTYGENEGMLAHDGPESLTGIAQHIGAHIYIANVGGPDVVVPGGTAAQDQPAQGNRGPSSLGTTPSSHMQSDQTAALNYFAYRTSTMMQTAGATLGGFANSLDDLGRQIHRDLDGNYSMDFNLRPEDRDQGTPSVEVRLARHDLRVAILDVIPIGLAPDPNRAIAQKELAEILKRASKKPVSSPDFRITQHVDYFPLHAGLEPILPMSGIVEWTGHGRGPAELSVIESVENLALSTMILEREIDVHWDGRSFSWERDGQLKPGSYIWRVAVHDEKGKILSSTAERVEVAFPHQPAVAVSSLILGKSCREENQAAIGLHRRSLADSTSQEEEHLQIDPLRVGDCRLKPESTDRFASTDMLHAFVRIYPREKLEKHRPGNWTAKFVLRSKSGAVETERETPFTIDSGSGYLASIEMNLNIPEVRPGPHTLDVEMRGPGIHSDLKEARLISILAPMHP